MLTPPLCRESPPPPSATPHHYLRSRSRETLAGTRGPGDRKSTRLNSSHSQISYAVFFFKDTAPTETYPLPLHDALPIYPLRRHPRPHITTCARDLAKHSPVLVDL